MLRRYAALIFRHAKLVLVLSGLALIAASLIGAGAFGKLKGGGFNDPGAEATQASQVIEERFGGQTNFVLLVRVHAGTVESAAAAQAGRDLTARLATEPNVSNVASFWSTGSAGLTSADKTEGMVVAHIAGDEDESAERAETLMSRYAVDGPTSTIRAGGSAAARVDVNAQVTKSLIIAEAIAVPVTWLLLILVFGSLVSALLPPCGHTGLPGSRRRHPRERAAFRAAPHEASDHGSAGQRAAGWRSAVPLRCGLDSG